MSARLGHWAKRMRTWGFLTRAKMNTRLRRWVKKSEVRRFFTFVRAVEFLAILIALIGFFNELRYWHEERTARAWQLLTTPAPGNSGKGEALEYLNSRGLSLESIDLTPPILAEQWKQIPIGERELEESIRNIRICGMLNFPRLFLLMQSLCVPI